MRNNQLLAHKTCKVIFGKNAIAKFKKHAQQMRAVAKAEFGMILGKKVGSQPSTQQQFKDFVQKVVDSGAARKGSWGGETVIGYRSLGGVGDGIVLLNPNGEFVTFLQRSLQKGGKRWDHWLPYHK
jgi:hypothetical protein